MKNIVSLLLLITGVVLGVYIGGWVMFISPILACALAFDAGLLTGMLIVAAALKCIFASFVGYLTFWVFAMLATYFNK